MSWTRSFGRFLGYVTAKLGIGVVKGKLGDKAGKVVDITKKAGVVLLAVTLMGASCREFGIGFGEGIVAGVADEFTPRPTPTRPPVVIEPTPTFTPNPTPTVTPNPPAPTPTQTPGPAPTATPPVVTPAPGAGCKPAPEPPDTPVSLLFPQGCPQGFEPALRDRVRNYCTVKAGCTTCTSSGGSEGPYTYEGKPARVVVETVAGMAEGNLRIVDGAWLACDVTPFGMDCHDAYGRLIRNGRPYVHPEGWTAPYTFSYTALPLTKCPETATPTPAMPSTPGPTPNGGVRGFSLGFTNVSDKCRGFRDHGGDRCSCEPDGAHRFKGTLIPQEKLVQNTVDRDHWHCAIEPCVKPADKTDAEWADILQAHRDTYQLSGGDEWIVAQGIRHEWKYADTHHVHVATPESNPYQGTFDATCGATVEARGCMDDNAYSCPDRYRGETKRDDTTERYSEYDCRPEHRRPVPGAGGCGPWKRYEVK